jgi:hypothetical protein
VEQNRASADVEAKLLELLDVYNVDYGAIDMIVSPEDEYYFIEINAAGEFFWLDNLTEGNLISKVLQTFFVIKHQEEVMKYWPKKVLNSIEVLKVCKAFRTFSFVGNRRQIEDLPPILRMKF